MSKPSFIKFRFLELSVHDKNFLFKIIEEWKEECKQKYLFKLKTEMKKGKDDKYEIMNFSPVSKTVNKVMDFFIKLIDLQQSLTLDTRQMSSQKERLLLREKDYDILAIKRKKNFQISIQDPLINPPKKKKGRKVPIGFTEKQSPQKGSNPLARLNRVSKMPQKVAVSQIAAISQNVAQASANQQQQNKANEGTPWEAILQRFLKVYDYRHEQYEPKLVNVFGSQGLKYQEELRAKLGVDRPNRQSSLINKKSEIKPQTYDKQTIKLSISTYLRIVNQMKKQLKSKWKKQDKVASLQVTIQSCKLLHDTSNAKLHAVKFAYVMQIVEQFGINVFERIKKLSFPNLPDERIKQITISQLYGANIPQSAQQICKNWINKISSIRQLVPRVFVQTTLLRLYFFIDNGVKAKKVLKRLARSNRCFGQYINCIFFSTFLIRIGKQVLPQEKDFILDILDDVFFYIKQGKSKFNREDITYDQFFTILQPFFISSFESLSESLSHQKFKRFCQILPQNPHPVILKNFIMSFSPSLLVSYSVDIAKILQKIYKEHKYKIYRILLDRLSGVVFPQSGQFIILVWTDISEVTDLEIMLDVLGPFSEIVFRNLPRYEKNRFYSLILQTFNGLFYNFRSLDSKIFESFQKFLTGILQKTQDMKDILTLQPFLQIISYFPTKNKRQISQSIAKTFLSRDQKIRDAVIVHIMLSLMKNMKGMQVKDLVLDFSSKVDFGTDFQQNLNFLAQMRATFGYLPEVTISLIYKAVNLTFRARKESKGRVTKKLVSFLQATLAYCYITVPVIEDAQTKLKLYLYLSQIALANNLISQATSLIKTCITQLSETQSDSDIATYNIFHRIISFMIVMPDDPESDYLFLFNGLYQAFTISKFKSNLQHILRFQFYTNCAMYISSQAQQRLPFHIQGVTSNDGLFKEAQFKIALVQRIHEIFTDMENTVKDLKIVEGIEIDQYLYEHLLESMLTLSSIFQNTPRFCNLINQLCKILQKFKDKLFRDQRLNRKYSPGFQGLINRLQQIQIVHKLKL